MSPQKPQNTGYGREEKIKERYYVCSGEWGRKNPKRSSLEAALPCLEDQELEPGHDQLT